MSTPITATEPASDAEKQLLEQIDDLEFRCRQLFRKAEERAQQHTAHKTEIHNLSAQTEALEGRIEEVKGLRSGIEQFARKVAHDFHRHTK
jgi:exonuclease VII large subunit